MMTLYSAEREALREFDDVINATANYVEYKRNGFRTRIYANVGAGEFFADSEEMEAQMAAEDEAAQVEDTVQADEIAQIEGVDQADETTPDEPASDESDISGDADTLADGDAPDDIEPIEASDEMVPADDVIETDVIDDISEIAEG